jgi:hypothetical protein
MSFRLNTIDDIHLNKAEIRNKKAQQKQKENILGGKGWILN